MVEDKLLLLERLLKNLPIQFFRKYLLTIKTIIMKKKTFTFFSSRRFLGFALGLSLVICNLLSIRASDQISLIVNPGFEEGIDVGWTGDYGNAVINTSSAKTGLNCLEIMPGGGGRYQEITTGFTVGSSYTLSAWGQISKATSGAYITLQARDVSNSKLLEINSSDISSVGSYELKEISFVVPEGTVTLRLIAYYDGGSATCFVDEFGLAEKIISGLINPGFEEGFDVGWTGDYGNSLINTTSARTGVNCLEITPASGGRYQEITSGFVVGNTYVLSAWGQLSESAAGAYIVIQARDTANVKLLEQNSSDISSVGTYELKEVTFTVPANTAKLRIIAWSDGGSATVYVDDYSLAEKTVVSLGILNTGFEEGFDVGWTGDYGNAVLNTTTARTAANCLKILPGGGGRYQEITTGFTTGVSYILSAWGQISEATNGAYITIQARDAADAKLLELNSPDISSVGNYEQKEIVFTVPENTAKLRIIAYYDGGSATFYVDDFSFVENNRDKTLLNLGFEEGLDVGWTGNYGNGVLNTSSPRTGANCLEILPAGGGRWQGTTNGFTAGKTYILSAWGTVSEATTGAYIVIQARDALDAKLLEINSEDFTSVGAYEQKKITFKVPEGTLTVRAIAYYDGGSASFLVDDFNLELDTTTTGIVNTISGSLKLYPNPLSGQILNISTPGISGEKNFSIFDVTGKMVFSQKLERAENQSIDLNGKVSKGLYLIKISNDKDNFSKLLIIK